MWGKIHFPAIYEELLTIAAEMVADERMKSIAQGQKSAPSKVEYLDLLRVIISSSNDLDEQKRVLEVAITYTASSFFQL